nr:hypothetical protein Iba_chr05cCG3750 [Ipomoea batatas]
MFDLFCFLTDLCIFLAQLLDMSVLDNVASDFGQMLLSEPGNGVVSLRLMKIKPRIVFGRNLHLAFGMQEKRWEGAFDFLI